MLKLRACWFEPGPPAHDLPELTATGEVSARVQHRRGDGTALAPLVAVPVRQATALPGRFVLEADPDIGLTPERRLLAVAAAQLVALVRLAPGAPGATPPITAPPPASQLGQR
ncbi:MAG: hypothetical protein ACRD0G_12695 [Acidimicrobiales bacterium]